MSRPTTELAHLFRVLKAPAAARALPKLADRARQEEWSYEQFAATLLKTEIDSRDSHGGQARIKAARFPARKTIEEFDFAFQTSLRRDTVLHLAQLDFLAGKENAVLLGPPGTGKTHLAIALGIRACLAGHRVAFRTATEWVALLADAGRHGRLDTAGWPWARSSVATANERTQQRPQREVEKREGHGRRSSQPARKGRDTSIGALQGSSRVLDYDIARPSSGRDVMSEGSTPPDTSPAAASVRRERRLELLVTVLLAIATVATAWSSYQSARWSGVQTINFSKANAARVESTRLSAQAGQQTQLDVATFIAWTSAYAAKDTVLSDFYFKRFRAEFKPAVEAWVATKPLKNSDAPLTPFVMPQYHLAAQDAAAALVRTADASTAQAKVDNQRSDNYVLAVVLFASSLFFAGISTKLERFSYRAAIVGLGYTLFLGTVIWLATFPVTVSI